MDQTRHSDPPAAERDADHRPAIQPRVSRLKHAIAVSPVIQGLLALMIYLTIWTITGDG